MTENFTFQQIEYFLKVAEHRSITKAANELYVSQPTVSRSIQAFEAMIGFPLFTRNAQGLFLTEEGKYIYLAIRPLYDSFFRVLLNASRIAGLSTKLVHAAISTTVYYSGCYKLVRRILDTFKEENSNYKVVESILEDAQICNSFMINDLSVSFCDEYAIQNHLEVKLLPIAQLSPYIIMSRKNPLSKAETLIPEQLNGQHFYAIANMESTAQRNDSFDSCSKLGFIPGDVKYPPNYVSFEHAIEQNMGIGVQFDIDQPPERDGIVYRLLVTSNVSPRLVAAYKIQEDNQSIQYFKDFVKDKCREIFR